MSCVRLSVTFYCVIFLTLCDVLLARYCDIVVPYFCTKFEKYLRHEQFILFVINNPCRQFTRRKKAQYESCEAEIISTPFNGHFPVYIPPHFRRECLGTIGSFTAQVPLIVKRNSACCSCHKLFMV